MVLVGFDALASDMAQLQELEWEVAVLDERDAQPASLAKAHQAVRDMTCTQKLLLSPANPATVSGLLMLVPDNSRMLGERCAEDDASLLYGATHMR